MGPLIHNVMQTVILHLICISFLKLTALNVQNHLFLLDLNLNCDGVIPQPTMQTPDVSSFSVGFSTELVFQPMTLNVPVKCVSRPAEMAMVSSYC